MISCDRCLDWFHGECVGISEGQAPDTFICPICEPLCNFQWGNVQGSVMYRHICSAYDEIVHWKRNLFLLPHGKASKAFLSELARLYQAFADASSIECLALKACAVLQCLVLQKPHARSKAKEHLSLLNRRLSLWTDGDVDGLLVEGRCIQQHLSFPNQSGATQENGKGRKFNNLMSLGKVNEALRLISKQHPGKLLSLDQSIPCGQDENGVPICKSTRDILIEKHPQGKTPSPDALLSPDTVENLSYDPVLFDQITGDAIRLAALHTHGAAGPSGTDAYLWRRFCSSFGPASAALCNALAAVARRVCTSNIIPAWLSAFTACRLVPLDKNPGVRPIGIGEVSRRIIAKVVLKIISRDIQLAAGPLQTCAGHECGIEAAVHAMKQIYASDDVDAVLLVDATNAFNTINRRVALHNIRLTCPAFSTILTNTYSSPCRLFIVGQGEISSSEGTTQGDPLAMAMYALAVAPLIRQLRRSMPDIKQAWYADDATAAGKLQSLHLWWQKLQSVGPAFGYFPNATKTHLVVKPTRMAEAQAIFADTQMQITSEGQRHLGAAIGTAAFTEKYVSEKVDQWVAEVTSLSTLARAYPHAAYSAFVHGLISRWHYLMRTVDNISHLFQPLEDAISQLLIPALTGRTPGSSTERILLSLPSRKGGLNLINPTVICQNEFASSLKISAPLTAIIAAQSDDFDIPQLYDIKSEVHQDKLHAIEHRANELRGQLPVNLQRSFDLSCEMGASSWLTVLPLQDHGFLLHKQEFIDALCMRYQWPLKLPPQYCVCGAPFSYDHAMICSHGGLTFFRHNAIRDVTARWLNDVCSDVEVEPRLQPLSGETLTPTTANCQDDARADIRARGFWGRRQNAFYDVRVFHPNAPSYRQSSLPALYRRHELIKKREYGDRVRLVEQASFTPLIFSSTGGMGKEAKVFYQRLANLLSTRQNAKYSTTLAWIRCTLSFSLLRSAVMCIRGSRSVFHRTQDTCLALGFAESRITAN